MEGCRDQISHNISSCVGHARPPQPKEGLRTSNVITLKDVAAALEPISNLTFKAVPFDLASIPSNQKAASERIDQMVTIRFACLMLRHDDVELTKVVSKEPDAFLGLVEEIRSLAEWNEAELEILHAAEARLLIALERYAHNPDPGEGEPIPESVEVAA